MSSSDSEDDCYGNIAQKLQNIKNKIVKENVENIVSNDSTNHAKSSETASTIFENRIAESSEITVEDLNTTVNSTDNDEFSLDAIIARNSKVKPKRGRGGKRTTTSETVEPTERETRSTRRRTSKNSTSGRTRPVNPAPVEQSSVPVQEFANARDRGSRGRARGRGRTRRDLWAMFDDMFGHMANANPLSTSTSTQYPTYSVGNTDEYPDQSDNQQLFSTRPVTDDIQVIEDEDQLEDDNEEMSVKVYWQNYEIFKFKIRKYQKLTQIFDFFTKKEGVSNENLLFTYNDRILRIDDTPDSIDYNIAKFIDGGIVNQNVTQLAQSRSKENENNGLKIKFQCQNKKKTFETTLRPQDKLALAMIKCAEHLETPLERLKFCFDGDLITGKNTPQDLELEGGECIDVKICS